MKAKLLGVALGCAVVAAGCGQGRAIFNVDVYSFLKGTGSDTVPYFLPPGISGDTASTKTVSGTTVTPDIVQADLTAAFDSLFTKSQLWIRFVANGSADPGITPLQGKAVLTSLQLTVIISDKFF